MATLTSLLLASLLPLLVLPAPAPSPRHPPSHVSPADLHRFPPRQQTFEAWHLALHTSQDFARRHEFSAAGCFPDAEFWRLAAQDADACLDAWNALDDAQRATCDADRLRGLSRLRECLGPEAYSLGLMPPPVPVWRWRRVGG